MGGIYYEGIDLVRGIPPVTEAETLEIFKFMHAADLSRKKTGSALSCPNNCI